MVSELCCNFRGLKWGVNIWLRSVMERVKSPSSLWNRVRIQVLGPTPQPKTPLPCSIEIWMISWVLWLPEEGKLSNVSWFRLGSITFNNSHRSVSSPIGKQEWRSGKTAFASHQCGLGSILAWCVMWVECVTGSHLVPRLFLHILNSVSGFSPSSKTNNSNFNWTR